MRELNSEKFPCGRRNRIKATITLENTSTTRIAIVRLTTADEAGAGRAAAAPAAPELNGRGGLDPARYGDWEVKGIAADF